MINNNKKENGCQDALEVSVLFRPCSTSGYGEVLSSVRSGFLCSFHAVCAPCERSSSRPRTVGVSASIHGGPSFYFSTWHLAPARLYTRLHPERLRSDLTRPGWISEPEF